MNTKEQYGDYETYKSIVEGTIEEFEDDEITSLKNYPFGNSNLRTINMPNVTQTHGTIRPCDNLESISLPSCTTLNGANGFLQNAKKLRSANFHSLLYAGREMFRNCSALTDVDLYSATGMGSSLFEDCTSLTKVVLPSMRNIEGYTFEDCTKLKIIDIYGGGTIAGSNAFITCFDLTTIIIRNDSKITTAISSFNMSSSSYIFYVTDSLVEDYKSATNWSAIANKIKPISELPEEETT